MADSSPLLASLLMGQRQTENPFEAQRKFGRNLIVQGSSMAPLGSGNPLEGLARALQGGIGGLMAGYATGEENAQNDANTAILSQAAVERDPMKAAALLKGLKGASAEQQALFGQIIQNNITEGLKQQQAEGVLTRGGGLGGDVTGAPPGGGLGITITPGQSGTGNNPNNVGNIGPGKQYETPQAGAADLAQLLQSYPVKYNNGQPMTLRQIARIYAPADDGKNPALRGNNPDQWAMNVGGKAGIHPDTPLELDNPAVLTRVVQGINPAEKAPGDVQPPEVLRQGVQQGMDNTAPPQTVPSPALPTGVQTAQAGPPAQMQLPQVPPAPDAVLYWKQAQQFASQGDNVKAVEYKQKAVEAQAKFAATLQEAQARVGMQGAEHDRQQSTATPNPEQSLSGGFSDRMMNSERLIRQYGQALTSAGAKAKDMIPFGLGNYGQSPEYQQARQARDDFINAQLRRESGAAIAPTEYINADKQYFPQPGDGPQVIAQKERNRQLAIEGMTRNAGPAYTPSPTVTKPQGGGGSDLLNQAREAIKQGASRDKVIERLKQAGVSAEGL